MPDETKPAEPTALAVPTVAETKPARPLNEKQLLFVTEYQVDFNATQAAVRAGYSAKTSGQISFKLLKNAQIQLAIKQALDRRVKRLELDADWVIRRLRRVYRLATAGGDYSAANRSLELIGKYLKLFTEQVDVTSKGKRLENSPKTVQVMVIAGQKVEF